MRVSVFEVRLANGSVGYVMVPSVKEDGRREVEKVFLERKPDGVVVWCSWEYDMWITWSIDRPIILTPHGWGDGKVQYVFK